MTISWPDPDIGRCKNYRSESYSDGFIESVRCLDYEGVQHVCSFPKFTHVVQPMGSGTYQLVGQRSPRPWVKPDEGQKGDG